MGLVTFQFPHLNCKIEVSQLYLNFTVVSDFTITFPPGLKIDFFLSFRFRWFHALLYSINTHLIMMNVLWWPLFTRSFLMINSKRYCPFLREMLSLYFRAGKWKLVLTFPSMKNFFKPLIYWGQIPSPAHLLLCRHQKVRCVSYDCIVHTKHLFCWPITVWYFINVFHDAISTTSLLREQEAFGETP